MADLSTMFNQLGPAGGSILAGVQMGNEANAAKSEQAMREAQMNKIIQETKQMEIMNPLEVQAKQQTIASNALKVKLDESEYHSKALADMIPRLESIPEAARHAAVIDMAHQAGIPMDQSDVQHLQTLGTKDIVPYLKRAQEHAITQNRQYRQAMDVAEVQRKSHMAGIGAQIQGQKDLEQMRIDAGKYNRNKVATDVNSALLKVRNAQQAAELLETAYYTAEAANDMKMAEQYKQRALQARQRAAEDAANRAAGAPGTMGVSVPGGGIEIQNKPPAAATAPIAGGPALGTAANPIKLD